MTRSHRLQIAIVGAGKVGTVLGRLLHRNGGSVTAVISRTLASARAGARFIGVRRFSTDPAAIPAETDVVLIATPHDAVEDVARRLAMIPGLPFRRMAFCHASGMLTADALRPLALPGGTVFSFHPLQTFPRSFQPRQILDSIPGITYGVDGPPRGVRMARRLATLLKGHVLIVPPELREFYHAACVVASNHLTALLSVVETMYREIAPGKSDFYRVFSPIIVATLRNVADSSPADALSGPVARGGVGTIARHCDTIQEVMPALLPYYTRMSLETLRLALHKGTLSRSQIEEMTRLLTSSFEPLSPIKDPQ
jgi:predicted short-subunit dehydrogenase-like oxidoreductase (DUF2520 family)